MNARATAAAATPPAAPSLGSAVRTVSSVTLMSRVGGLIRDLMLVYVFRGAGPISSAFLSAFAVPNMFRRLFGEGALSAAFIPEYTRALATRREDADRFASLTVAGLLAATGALTVAIEAALLVILLVAPGDENRQLSLRLVMVMLPFMPLVCAAALLSGMLQVHGRFGPASSGPLILNGFIVAAGAYYLATGQRGGATVAYVLGGATVLSGLTQCLWFLRLLRGRASWTRDFTGQRERALRMGACFIPVLIGLGTLQINTFIDTLLAAWPNWIGPTMFGRPCPMDLESASIIGFTQRLYQFPLGVFGIAVATAVFPMLSRHADHPAEFAATLRRGLRLSLFIGLPASIGLFLVRRDLTATLFSFGAHGFSPESLDRSAAVLCGFAPAVWAYSLNHVLTRAFYARGDTRTPMRIALVMVGFNLTLNLVLIWWLAEAGLAWSTSVSAAVQCCVLVALSRSGLGAAAVDRETLGAFLRVGLAAALMGVGVWWVQGLIPAPTGWSGRAVSLLAGCAAGTAIYLGAALALRCPELAWLARKDRP
ncbi:MAG: murein biosynthesis integral membrane protein MurJ [Phycisphaerales bacterium]|nr:murein biosynthesis integral membrane protein MurJ [Phycisphaerales bacterium]